MWTFSQLAILAQQPDSARSKHATLVAKAAWQQLVLVLVCSVRQPSHCVYSHTSAERQPWKRGGGGGSFTEGGEGHKSLWGISTQQQTSLGPPIQNDVSIHSSLSTAITIQLFITVCLTFHVYRYQCLLKINGVVKFNVVKPAVKTWFKVVLWTGTGISLMTRLYKQLSGGMIGGGGLGVGVHHDLRPAVPSGHT